MNAPQAKPAGHSYYPIFVPIDSKDKVAGGHTSVPFENLWGKRIWINCV